MATSSVLGSHTAQTARNAQHDWPVGGLRFDLISALLSLWFLIGLYTDGWAHNNLPGEFETFFTPWHGILYSGALVVMLWKLGTIVRNLYHGYPLRRALPLGYHYAVIGSLLFMAGGIFDFLWHSFFGFEENVEALISPSHLWLATAGMLLGSGPMRAAWYRHRAETQLGWRDLLPALLSLLGTVSLLTFFTQYVHFLADPETLIGYRPTNGRHFIDVYGITSILIPCLIYTGAILYTLRRWRLPVGSITLVVGVNLVLMFIQDFADNGGRYWLLVGPLLACLLCDLLLIWLKPTVRREFAFRCFALLLPFAIALGFLLTLRLSEPVWWKIHMWLGVPFCAGIAGLLVSFLVLPPAEE